MNKSQIDDIAYFLAFCVEIYKNAHSLSGAEASAIFAKNELYDYLSENFEVLHTQSPAWILEEIEEIIKQQKV